MSEFCRVSRRAKAGKLAVSRQFGYNTAISFSGILSGNQNKS